MADPDKSDVTAVGERRQQSRPGGDPEEEVCAETARGGDRAYYFSRMPTALSCTDGDPEDSISCIALRMLEAVSTSGVQWRKLTAEGLDLDYTTLLSKPLADRILQRLETDLEHVYFTGNLAQVKVYGKWHPIHRQQVAFGDEGLAYKFSGVTVPALPWPPLLLQLRDLLRRVSGHHFNFVLVNRYRDGSDHIGEHRDDERDLDRTAPIASLSLGQWRNFVFRHRDARKRGSAKRNIPPVKMVLEHGSLLMMNPPTNELWYHSLPPRKSCPGVRLNFTFRKILKKPGNHSHK